MQFIDLGEQQKRIRKKIDNNIQNVLNHGKYIMGPEVQGLEERLAAYCGVKHAISCSSGTDALLIALMANGIGPGDAILTSPFTFIATAEVISLLGATPVFVDIEPTTFNIDPQRLQTVIGALKSGSDADHPLPGVDEGVQLRPRAIIAVDLFGLPADYDRINDIAAKEGLLVIEDAAQSFGASLNDKRACSLAEIACTSFFPAKPLGCYGDGGMCFTESDELAARMISLRVHGKGQDKYDNIRIGINGRLDTIQAAVLQAKMDIFEEEVEMRNAVAERYGDHLASISSSAEVPVIPSGYKSVWAQYTITLNRRLNREVLQEKLKTKGIPSAIYYPKSLHMQTAFRYLGYKQDDFPVSEDLSARVLSLPMHPYLDQAQQSHIANALKDAIKDI